MDSNKVLAGEFCVALAINSWGAIKQGYAPWPGSVMRSAAAFGILGVAAIAAPDLATLLGAGFLLALLVKALPTGTWGAVPPTDTKYYYIKAGA